MLAFVHKLTFCVLFLSEKMIKIVENTLFRTLGIHAAILKEIVYKGNTYNSEDHCTTARKGMRNVLLVRDWFDAKIGVR